MLVTRRQVGFSTLGMAFPKLGLENAEMAEIKERRQSLGLSLARLADLAGTSAPQIHRLERGERKMTPQWAKRLAPHLGCSPEDLLADSDEFSGIFKNRAPQAGRVNVVGFLQAGEWREAVRWHDDDIYGVPVFDERYQADELEGFEVRGDSMNLVYPPQTVVICRRFDPVHELPPVGRNVVVQRRDHNGMIEATVKHLEADEHGRGWLVPHSTNPNHQRIPYQPNGDGDDDTEITGVVVGSYRRE